ncbi:MAG: hypothetical protein PWQ59_442 [Thermoanaerobacterium sp.]|nr:hypothetical protein [Thermoanaerobacterium sp.]
MTAFKGQRLVIYCSDATNAVTVTTKAGTTLDGTNNKATFGTGDVLELFAVSDTQFVILENVGAVTLASV